MTQSNVSANMSATVDTALANPLASDAVRQGTRVFWEGEKRLLDSFQHFTTGWLARRQQGTEAALGAARSMCEAPTLVDAIEQWQTWAAGSVERLRGDALAWQEHVTACAALMVAPEAAGEPRKGSDAAPAIDAKGKPRSIPAAA